MKIKMSLLLLLGFIYANVNATSFVIKGTVDEALNDQKFTIYRVLPHPTDIQNKEIDCIIKDGSFEFELEAEGIEIYVLKLTIMGQKYSELFYLDPKETTIHFKTKQLDKYEIVGNDIHTTYAEFYEFVKNLPLKEAVEYKAAWIVQHPTSALCSIFLYELLKLMPEVDLKKLYALLPEENLNNSWGSTVTYLLKNLTVGVIAPIFSQNDVNQNIVNLTDFRGKYVFVDFWASWCVPCREETPYLVSAYKNYKQKGFAILSVSLDDDAEKWKEAIAKDSMTWVNVSELKGWNSFVSKSLYKLNSIPANYLLDPNGKIIAKNLRGKALEEQLKEIFPQN